LNGISDQVNEEISASQFNPYSRLDKTVPNELTQKAMKIDFAWEGVDYSKSSKWYWEQNAKQEYHIGPGNIRALVERMKQRFSGNATLQADLNWFLNVWPKAEEVVGMGSDSVYNNSGQGQQYMVNEYGQLMSQDQVQGSERYSQDVTRTNGTFTVTDGSFNNRNYGYRYTEGYQPKIKLVTSGREYVLQDYVYRSPIVLDLDGDGKLEASNGQWRPHTYDNAKIVEFDMNGDDFIDLTEWVGPNDGLLLTYNGKEVNGTNLFGDIDGYEDGYKKLATLDANGDQCISGDELATLSVWQDKNGNARVDAGEITRVTDLGITAIHTRHHQKVSYFEQNGKKRTMWDWYPCFINKEK
jgi:hypothetical protein